MGLEDRDLWISCLFLLFLIVKLFVRMREVGWEEAGISAPGLFVRRPGWGWPISGWFPQSQCGASSPLFSISRASFPLSIISVTKFSEMYILWFLITLMFKNFCVHFMFFKRWLLCYVLLHREPNRTDKLVRAKMNLEKSIGLWHRQSGM